VSLSSAFPKAKASTFKEGDIVSISPLAKSHAEDLPALSARGEHNRAVSNGFTYEAYVYRVLDGDTIEAVVDLGFGFTTTQVLRLRGIDAPELTTRDGMLAKEYLESVIARSVGENVTEHAMCEGMPGTPCPGLAGSSRVLVRSVKSDKYDRYLIDLYTVGPNGESQYVNNLLLEGEYAVKVGE
jgi:micrococcal nuclease